MADCLPVGTRVEFLHLIASNNCPVETLLKDSFDQAMGLYNIVANYKILNILTRPSTDNIEFIVSTSTKEDADEIISILGYDSSIMVYCRMYRARVIIDPSISNDVTLCIELRPAL